MIDWQRVIDLKQAIGARIFDEVVGLFLEESEAVIARLPAATTANDMKNDLHILKGSALNLGFIALADLCESGEQQADSGETDLPLAQVAEAYFRSRTEFLAKLALMVP